MQVNKEVSQKIAACIEVKSEAYWRNAFEALSHLPEAVYVEGWAVALEELVLFEHAWLEQAGQIIDPTLWETALTYFAGLRFTAAEARSTLANQGQLPLAHRPHSQLRNTPLASNSPAYWSAWETANKFFEGRKRAHLWRSWRRWLDLIKERS